MGKSVLTIHICIEFLPRVKGITGYDDMQDVMSRKGENLHEKSSLKVERKYLYIRPFKIHISFKKRKSRRRIFDLNVKNK